MLSVSAWGSVWRAHACVRVRAHGDRVHAMCVCVCVRARARARSAWERGLQDSLPVLTSSLRTKLRERARVQGFS